MPIPKEGFKDACKEVNGEFEESGGVLSCTLEDEDYKRESRYNPSSDNVMALSDDRKVWGSFNETDYIQVMTTYTEGEPDKLRVKGEEDGEAVLVEGKL